MGSNGFNVPTIPPDLRKEETIHHIADALEYLDKVANEVFTRISKRVGENKTHLQKINDRVNLAAARVDKLKGSNKATKVFACAKYPSEAELGSFQGLVNDTDGLKSPKHSHFKVQEKHSFVNDRILRDKLSFYNVHLNTKARKDQNQQGEGLGGLPRNVPSVSSLLLFNTTENPYKKYVMLDPLGVVTKTRAAIEEEEAGMAEAPSTIVHNERMFRATAETFQYMPDIGDVPEIAVPDLLPNLPGVADDEAFSADQGPSIAPSVMGSLMPDLPEVGGGSDVLPPGPSAAGPSTTIVENTSAPPPPPPPDAAPPPPPPPPPSSSAPAPPPPPPPPPPDAPPPPPPPSAPGEVPSEVAQPSSGRENLLDSIRKAGGASGAGLKSAKDRKLTNKKKKQEEKEQGASSSAGGGGGGGDLMSDLFSKLNMRRKGISGSKTAEGKSGDGASASSGGSAMDKISSMIPPPPKAQAANEGSDDDNWD